VVINHHVWQELLGKSPDVIGSTIQLNDTAFTVAGVTSSGFPGLSRSQRTDVWVTVAQAHFVVPGLLQEVASPYQRWFEVIGRVKPDSANAIVPQLQTLVSNWHRENAEQYNNAVLSARSYMDEERSLRTEGVVFLGLVALVLLMASANVANLTLARNESRRREMAVRAALGGSRLQLMAHASRESIVLCMAGSLFGLLLAAWVVDLFQLLIPPGALSSVIDVRIDSRFLAFTGIITVVTILLVGILPAWRHVRSNIAVGLKEETLGSAPGGRRFSIRDFLVVTQVAISVIVLIAAGLLVRSFLYGLESNPGFDTAKNVATFYLVPGLKGYDTDETYRFFEEARLSAATLPGVRRSSYAIRLPAQANEAGWAADFTIPGKEPPPGELYFRIKYTMAGPNYFEVMGTRILRGRGITEDDLPDSEAVAIVNESMSARFWPGEDPIGRTIIMGRRNPTPRTIVGVAEDNKIANLYEEQQMYVYVPYAQDRQSFGLLLVETDAEAQTAVAPVRQKLAEIDPSLPVLDTGSFASHLNVILYDQRRDAWVAVGISALALFLGIVGVYGVVSLVTKRRTREIGIRIALGAARGEVLRLVLGRVLRLTACGVILGAIGGVFAGQMLQSRLHGVGATDPVSILIGASMLFAAATFATMVPSWRASRVDPTEALRGE
jgi:predicted permease